MNEFDQYQETTERLKDGILEENRRLNRQLAEKEQSFELVKMVHFDRNIDLRTLNDIIIGCTGCLHAMMFSNKKTISNLPETDPLYQRLIADRERLIRTNTLIVDPDFLEDYTLVVYPVAASDMLTGHHHFVRSIVMLYPKNRMDTEVLAFVRSFMIINEVLINIVLTRERMMELIETDPLTKAFNRLSWRENIAWFIDAKTPFFILFVDLDRFKQINDTYGHAKGDEILKLTVAWLKSVFRADDKVFRLGGDEFAVAGFIDPTEENFMLEKLKTLNESYSKSVQQFLGLEATVSLGALIVKNGTTEEDLFARADELLYQSKENGRGTITVVSEI